MVVQRFLGTIDNTCKGLEDMSNGDLDHLWNGCNTLSILIYSKFASLWPLSKCGMYTRLYKTFFWLILVSSDQSAPQVEGWRLFWTGNTTIFRSCVHNKYSQDIPKLQVRGHSLSVICIYTKLSKNYYLL
jgi:hypothetical protein